ncbi:MAG TPA: PTS sugar transporter subunit IIA [Gemmataceae bacterium]|nr:PTS sugar transporter subunit IIA [Gemmataceae bacterium]
MMEPWEQIAAKLGFPLVVLPDAASVSAETAIRFLVSCLVADGLLDIEAADEVVRNLLARERLGATALGRGIALPHAKSSGLRQVIGILAHAPDPVPWDGSGPGSVRIICLVLSPADRPGDSLRALERVSRAMRA